MSTVTANSETVAAKAEKFYGKYPGRVLKQEAQPAKGDYGGQLWIEVPAILEDDPSDQTGAKKRPLHVRALPCFPPGFFFVPEPGAHVWVEFAAGDINQAIWTGVWYPPEAKPEEFRSPKTVKDKPPTKHQKIIRTPSGNVIQLDDTGDGGETIELVNKSHKRCIRLDEVGILLEFGEPRRVIRMNDTGIEISFKTDSGRHCIKLNDEGIVLEDDKNNRLALGEGGITIQTDAVMTDKSIVLETSGGKLQVEASSVKLSDGMGNADENMKLVLLAPLIDTWLAKHNHTGNMGGPTPPFPADLVTLNLPITRAAVQSGPM